MTKNKKGKVLQMNKLKEIEKNNNEDNDYKMFEDIKHIDENGVEYWYARELQILLTYKKWQKFEDVIEKAKIACKKSKNKITDHFIQVGNMVQIGSNTEREIVDHKLTRYACYLIAMNGDSKKPVIAQAQTYFAIQTRKQELTEQEYNLLDETEKRFYNRNITKKGNFQLNQVAKNSGVKNFDRFHNEGYKGLYNGETANDIAKRKGLRYREDILDNMGSDELAANIFRISQTKQKLENDKVKCEKDAFEAHNKIGKIVRKAIKEAGGKMPEDFPTPKKSLKELEKENKRKLKRK